MVVAAAAVVVVVVVIKKGYFCNTEFAHNEFSFPDSNVLVFFRCH